MLAFLSRFDLLLAVISSLARSLSRHTRRYVRKHVRTVYVVPYYVVYVGQQKSPYSYLLGTSIDNLDQNISKERFPCRRYVCYTVSGVVEH